MAQRRMFSNRIGNSAKFLQMPESSQLLYFHMVLRADDDGVVEVYPLMKLLGTPKDSFKVLVVKEFIQILNEDQVCVINDWLEHNTIRADRKTDSLYKGLLPANVETIEAKPRSDVKNNSQRVSGPSTVSLSKVRLGKDRLSKVNTTTSTDVDVVDPEKKKNDETTVTVIEAFTKFNPACKRYYGNKTQRGASLRLADAYGLPQVLKIIAILPETNQMDYVPVITTPLQLENKWLQLAAAIQKKKNIKKANHYIL